MVEAEPNIKNIVVIDPALQSIADNLTPQVRKHNWRIIAKEIKKIGVRFSKDVRIALAQGDEAQHMAILKFLIHYFRNGGC